MEIEPIVPALHEALAWFLVQWFNEAGEGETHVVLATDELVALRVAATRTKYPDLYQEACRKAVARIHSELAI